jgi:aminoglycoside phosphotransferase (APT) family kinase protein
MIGGITSSVHRLSILSRTGARTQVVLKRFSGRRLGDEGAVIRNEAAALTAVHGTGTPAPRLLGLSPDGIETSGMPALLMTRAPGRVWLTPVDVDAWIRQLARLLPTLHAGTAAVGTLSRRDPDALAIPQSAPRPDVWAAATKVVATEPPPCELVHTHGDYQHFNVLWKRGRLTALVDWSASRMAPADVDVGHCRLNLAVLFSAEVAERFRLMYESEAGRRVEPWWDLHQLLAYGDDWPAFIPVQVAGRAPLDTGGMTGRVERLLADALARL